ncbi:MAG: sensor histidine kinase [Flavobacteriales bacterium]|jgi:sensor histidine kinase YesM
MTTWFYGNILLRNIFTYVSIGILIAAVNFIGLQELLEENPYFLLGFLKFYSLTYILCFVHNRVLYERLLKNRFYLQYFLFIIASALVWTIANEFGNPYSLSNCIYTSFGSFCLIILGFGLYMFYQSVLLRQWNLKNNLTNTQQELALLKSQLNPHFLFNALNNLYGVSISQPEKISDFLLMLSDLLRYQVDGSKRDRVALKEELMFIEKFVSYEKFKLAHRGEVNLKTTDSPNFITIAPMILFPFIENAFKFSNHLHQPFVDIKINLNKTHLVFECVNSFHPELREKSAGTKSGLINTKQRLELQYPQKHILKYSESQNTYIVSLELQLSHG